MNRNPPRDPGEIGEAGISEAAGSGFDSRNSDNRHPDQVPPSPALWSEALCAGGKCVVATLGGLKPTRIELRLSQSGRWKHWIDGFANPITTPLGLAIVMAGTAARHLSDSDELDVVAALENTVASAVAGDPFRFIENVNLAMDMIEPFAATVRAIAGQLVATRVMSGEELAVHLGPVLRRPQ